MKRWLPIIANVVLFDALWTLAVLGAGKPWWWAAPVLIVLSGTIQLRWSPAPRTEAIVILLGATIGVALDALANTLGLFRYCSPSRLEFFLVFISLWINFGTTLRPSLSWMWTRPVIAAVLGGIGGPLAYWMAMRLGAITPNEPSWRALAWCGAQYALALPLWMLAASTLIPASRAPTPPSSAPASPPTQGTPAS